MTVTRDHLDRESPCSSLAELAFRGRWAAVVEGWAMPVWRRAGVRMVLAVVLVAAVPTVFASQSRAATVFAVTNDADAGPGSLRQPVLDARGVNADAKIHIDAGLSTTRT